MSNEETIANPVGLMTSFYFQIKALPDDLKCVKCKYVLINACQMPCGCRFCCTCIDDVISGGDQFCPGGSQECGATPLSTAVSDYSANKSVLKLTAKCPYMFCRHECPLADMEDHMRACPKKNIDCHYCKLKYPRVLMGPGQLDNWLIDAVATETDWGCCGNKTIGEFEGRGRPFIVKLNSSYLTTGFLWITVRAMACTIDSLLEWPFSCRVKVTVADRDKREMCSSQKQHCIMEMSEDDDYLVKCTFVFKHRELTWEGVDLRRGVCISCRIMPGSIQYCHPPDGCFATCVECPLGHRGEFAYSLIKSCFV